MNMPKVRRRRTAKKKQASEATQEERPAAEETSEGSETPSPQTPPPQTASEEPSEAAGSAASESSAARPKRRRRRKGIKKIAAAPTGPAAAKMMLVNVAEGDECRVAILEHGRLQELYIERAASLSHVGNIYKGVVTNVEPSIQAAFVDFGEGKNGFLHISDLLPQYFPGGGQSEGVGRKTPRRERPPIQKCLRRNQEIVVQVTKEGIGTKGPTLTTYLALPGRYLVMMPGMRRLGVSRKIEDEQARSRMRELLSSLRLPKDMGFILRTAGSERTKRELQRDLNYLLRLWKQIQRRMETVKAPAELYRESDLVTRTLRDVLTSDVERIIVDDEATAERARQFLRVFSPRMADRIEYWQGAEPLFEKFGAEQEIATIHSKRVPLKSGGDLIIESTEALVAIDVNSGKFRRAPDAEEAAFKINLEAAEEIARQLRLRDLGGVIICDFIDMRVDRHRREVERALRDALKKHKERAEILRMSRFGIIEMTRQRQRPSIVRSMFADCPTCGGSGLIKSTETVMLEALRALRAVLGRSDVARIELRVHPEVADLLLNRKRRMLSEMEAQSGRAILIHPDPSVPSHKVHLTCLDGRGFPVQVEPPKALLGAENR